MHKFAIRTERVYHFDNKESTEMEKMISGQDKDLAKTNICSSKIG